MLWSRGGSKKPDQTVAVRKADRFAKEQHHAHDDDCNPAFDSDECRCCSARAAKVVDQSDTAIAAHDGAWPDGHTAGAGRSPPADTEHASARRAQGRRQCTPGAGSVGAHSKHLQKLLNGGHLLRTENGTERANSGPEFR